MPTVQSTIQRPDGAGIANVIVEITLVGTGGGPVEGYAAGIEITGTTQLVTNASGFYSTTLTGNASITPTGTVYKIVEKVPGDEDTKFVTVPTSGGPYNVSAILTDPPGALVPSVFQAHIDNGAVHSGGSGVTTHTGLTGVTADQHHAQAHSISGADHTGTLTHAALGTVTSDQHHVQLHGITDAAHHSGTLAHSALGTVTSDQHHTENHQTRHAVGGADILPQLVHLAQFQFKGPLVAGVGVARVPVPFACTVAFVAMTNGVTSSLNPVKADLNYSSTYSGSASTLYTTQANRPTIAAGSFGTTATLPDTTALAASSYITADLDEIGTGAQTVVLDVYVTRP